MDEHIEQVTNELSSYIVRIIEGGSSEELQLLPDLINALANLNQING